MVEKLKMFFYCPDSCTARKVLFIVALFVMICMAIITIFYLQGRVFEGVRSYIRGEGLWAKAQQNAVYHLSRYSFTKNSSELTQFYKDIRVNLGDHEARLALSLPTPDLQTAREGFLAGNNDPHDIDSMIWFFLNFQFVYYLQEAIAIWTQGDVKIEELVLLAKRLQHSVEENDTLEIELLQKELDLLDAELMALELRFSDILGQGARWVKSTFWYATVSIVLVFIVIAMGVSRQIIKNLVATQHRLEVSEMRFLSLFASNTIGIVSWHLDGRIDDANSYFLDLVGYSGTEVKEGTLNWMKLTPPKWIKRDNEAIGELMKYGRCEPYEKEFINKTGETIPVYLGASFIDTYRDRGIAFIIDLRENRAQAAKQRLSATVFEASHDGIMIMDSKFNILSANKAMYTLTQMQKTDLQGDARAILESSEIAQETYDSIYTRMQDEGFWEGDVIIQTKYAKAIPVHVSVSVVKDENQIPINFVAIFADISERKKREDRLRHMAHHDPLTGLANRSYLESQIQDMMEYAMREQKKFALLFFDLDKFKPINDTYGHEAGDALLQCVAKRLGEQVRTSDTVARIGGDEFVILLEDVKNAAKVESIRAKIVAHVCQPCTIAKHSIDVEMSVGVSIYPDHGQEIAQLLHHADTQMYAMKKNRR